MKISLFLILIVMSFNAHAGDISDCDPRGEVCWNQTSNSNDEALIFHNSDFDIDNVQQFWFRTNDWDFTGAVMIASLLDPASEFPNTDQSHPVVFKLLPSSIPGSLLLAIRFETIDDDHQEFVVVDMDTYINVQVFKLTTTGQCSLLSCPEPQTTFSVTVTDSFAEATVEHTGEYLVPDRYAFHVMPFGADSAQASMDFVIDVTEGLDLNTRTENLGK